MKYNIVTIGNKYNLTIPVEYIPIHELNLTAATDKISKADKVILNTDIDLKVIALLGIALAKSKPVFAFKSTYEALTKEGLQHNLIFNLCLDEALGCDLRNYLGYDVNCRTHVMLTPLQGTNEDNIGVDWKCEYCDMIGKFDNLEGRSCTYEYPPCTTCGRTVICAKDCGMHMHK